MPGDKTSKHILLFGAGKSATILIDYLKALSSEKNWRITIADHDAEAVRKKVGSHANVDPVSVDVHNNEQRSQYIQQADLVISLMPPNLHYLIVLDCIDHKKHLLTASYVDDQVRELAEKIKAKNILFLCEMGLDPGIDHMRAMKAERSAHLNHIAGA